MTAPKIPLRDQAEADRIGSGVQQVVALLTLPAHYPEFESLPTAVEFKVPCRCNDGMEYGGVDLDTGDDWYIMCSDCDGSSWAPAFVDTRRPGATWGNWVPLTATVAHVVKASDIVWEIYHPDRAWDGWETDIEGDNSLDPIWVQPNQRCFLVDDDGNLPTWVGLLEARP